MINNEMFTSRLQEIFDYYELSASAFAEKMGVGRSSISHIVSGRNKPSLDFVLHILENFKEVSFDWLILGKGSFPKSNDQPKAPTLFQEDAASKSIDVAPKISQSITSAESITPSIEENHSNASKTIDRIVIFYKDHSFKEYKN